METTAQTINALAGRLLDHGFGDDSLDLLVIAHAARDLGVNDILVQLMIDDQQPEVARMRAFARVSSAISSRLDAGGPEITPRSRELAAAL